MKKIFAISMLAIFVVGAARAEWSPAYDDNDGNLNISTVKLLEEYAVPQHNVANGNSASYAAEVQSTGETDEYYDTQVPSINAVSRTFVPNEAVEYRDDWHGIVETAMRPGLYTIMVGVDDNGNKSFIWQAVQESRGVSSVGGAMPN